MKPAAKEIAKWCVGAILICGLAFILAGFTLALKVKYGDPIWEACGGPYATRHPIANDEGRAMWIWTFRHGALMGHPEQQAEMEALWRDGMISSPYCIPQPEPELPI